MAKKLYTVIGFRQTGNPAPIKFRNVNNLEKCGKYLAGQGIAYFNAYEKATRQYVGRTYVKTT